MPALQVSVREHLADAPTSLRETALHVRLPSAGDAVAALLAGIDAPKLARVAVRVRNTRLLTAEGVVGCVAHVASLERFQALVARAERGEGDLAGAPEVQLKVEAKANASGRCARARALFVQGFTMPCFS